MNGLTLKPGPALIARRWHFDEQSDSGNWEESNVTGRAHEHLFETVTLDAAATLADIFALLDASPLLCQVFRSDFAEELCAEARKGAVQPLEQSPPEGIEYLELYQQWDLDTGTETYTGTQRLHLHGIGFELAADADEYGCKRGDRIQWSVSLTPLREMLCLPVRLNTEVRVIEADVNAKAYGEELSRGRHPEVTLGQVIHGILWELSFHGGPQEQSRFRGELKEQIAELEAGTATLTSGTEFFDQFDRPGCEMLFDDLGGQAHHDIARALREIEDDENAAAWIDAHFGGAVVVKPRFRNKTGREFRKAFQAAGR